MCSEHVLDISDGLHEMGGFQSQVVVALVVAWAIVYLVLIRVSTLLGRYEYRYREVRSYLIHLKG